MNINKSRKNSETLEMALQAADCEESNLCSLNSTEFSANVYTDENDVDFVLVWDDRIENSNSSSAHARREVFELHLRQEGLLLESEPPLKNGLHFTKIRAPMEVLKRYAEILGLKLPMKKFDHIKELSDEKLDVPLLSEVFVGVQSWFSRCTQPFMFDETKFPARVDELTAPFSANKEYLFDLDRPGLFSQSTRSRIIEFILKRKRLSEDPNDEFAFGIDKALTEGTYIAAYPLHDGSPHQQGCNRNLLFTEWASFRKVLKLQPLDAIRDYFGVKIGLYFAWLGFYTNLLIVPSIVGLLTFLYGVFSSGTDIPSQEICNSKNGTVMMCPECDYFCDYWDLQETCLYSSILYLFDNESTVFFAIFISIWAALFLELWKRYSAAIVHRWDVDESLSEEEHPRPEYLLRLKNVAEKKMNFVTMSKEPKVPFWSRKIPGITASVAAVLFMVCLVLAAVFGVIIYRMAMIGALSIYDQDLTRSTASLFISSTGAIINLFFILLVNQLYSYLAERLTELELNRTQSEYDDSLSLKIYLLQFVNYYSSIFYIAFFKGKFIGRPGDYNKIFNLRQEECSPGGCYMELCLQLAIIFVGKQFVLSIFEYYLPKMWKLYNAWRLKSEEEKRKEYLPQWQKDFKLVEWGRQALFYEYLEMVIQYGFVTIFVSAFPLAPLFALINNIFELRVDAKKLLFHHRRPVARRVRDIGIWLHIMDSLGKIAVFTNAVIISFTSEFIPKLVYKYHYSPDGSLRGYTEFSLSYFDPDDFGGEKNPRLDHPDMCRYIDYRYPPDSEKKYQLNEAFWLITTARLAFVIIFQNFVNWTVMVIKWVIPNISSETKDKIKRQAYVSKEIIIRTELLKARGKLKITSNGISTLPEESEDEDDSQGNNLGVNLRKRRPSYSIEGKTGDVTDGDIVV